MRTIPIKLKKETSAALAQVANATKFATDLVEDVYATLLVKAAVWPDEATQDRLIEHYKKTLGGFASMAYRRRLFTLKRLTSEDPYKSALAKVNIGELPIEVTRLYFTYQRLSENLKQVIVCANCNLRTACAVGEQVTTYRIRHLGMAVAFTTGKARHPECPNESRFKEAESGNITEKDGDSIVQVTETEEVAQEEEGNFASLTCDDSGLTEEESEQYHQTKIEGFSRSNGKFLPKVTVPPYELDNLIQSLTTANKLQIFLLAAALASKLRLRAEDKNKAKLPTESFAEDRTVTTIKSPGDVRRITTEERSKPADLQELRQATRQAEVVQHVRTERKAQAIYILVDVSGSMCSGTVQMDYLNGFTINCAGVAAALTAAIIRRASKEGGVVLLRTYAGIAHELGVAHPKQPKSYTPLELRVIRQAFSGGTTSITCALVTALSDFEQGTTEYGDYTPKEILVITDGADRITAHAAAKFAEQAAVLNIKITVLLLASSMLGFYVRGFSETVRKFADLLVLDYTAPLEDLIKPLISV